MNYLRLAVLLVALGFLRTAAAQPYDLIHMSGTSSLATFDSLGDPIADRYGNFYCNVTAPKADLNGSYLRGGNIDWTFHGDTLSTRDHNFNWIAGPGPNTQVLSKLGSDRHLFSTNGYMSWDADMQLVSVYPLAPRSPYQHHSFRPSGYHAGSSVVLPVRDTPGVFRHIVSGYNRLTDPKYTYITNSYDQVYDYRLDLRRPARGPLVYRDGTVGHVPHARYTPSPDYFIDPDDPAGAVGTYAERAVAWRSPVPEGTAFDTARLIGRLPKPAMMTVGRYVAVAHGNGRDWWLVANGGQPNATDMGVFLVDPDGIRLVHTYGNALPFNPSYQGVQHLKLNVSQQGDRVALHAIENERDRVTTADYYAGVDTSASGIALWDFDRCSGELLNLQHFDIDYRVDGYQLSGRPLERGDGGGVAFSPSGRYLYYSERSYIGRLDLEHPDPLSTDEDVLDPDTLAMSWNGPDGDPDALIQFHDLRVFWGAEGAMILTTHSTAKPMLWNLDAEDADDVVADIYGVQTRCTGAVQNVGPYMQLYDLDGAPCDTLGVDGYDPPCASYRQESPDTLRLCQLSVAGSFDTVRWRGLTITAPGEYESVSDFLPGACDSVYRAVVEVGGTVSTTTVVRTDVAPGRVYGGVRVDRDTTFRVDYARAGACDSLVTYVIDVRGTSGSGSAARERLAVWPNPLARGGALVVGLPEGARRVVLTDVRGRVVRDARVRPGASRLRLRLDVPSGVYLVRMEVCDGGAHVARVVVQ